MSRVFRFVSASLLIVILLTGCATPFSQYTSYVTGVSNGDNLQSDVTSNIWEYDKQREKEPAEVLTVPIEGMQVTGTYSNTKTQYRNSFRSHEYWNEIGQRFRVNALTGEVHSYFDVGYYREADAAKTMPPDPRVYTQELATTIAKKYVDVGDYKLELMNPDATEESTGFIYRFTKYLAGLPTNDYVWIALTRKGTLISLEYGDLGMFDDIRSSSISLNAIDKSIQETVAERYSNSELGTYLSHEVRDQKICRTPNNKLAVVSEVIVTIKSNSGEEWKGLFDITTVIE